MFNIIIVIIVFFKSMTIVRQVIQIINERLLQINTMNSFILFPKDNNFFYSFVNAKKPRNTLSHFLNKESSHYTNPIFVDPLAPLVVLFCPRLCSKLISKRFVSVVVKHTSAVEQGAHLYKSIFFNKVWHF